MNTTKILMSLVGLLFTVNANADSIIGQDYTCTTFEGDTTIECDLGHKKTITLGYSGTYCVRPVGEKRPPVMPIANNTESFFFESLFVNTKGQQINSNTALEVKVQGSGSVLVSYCEGGRKYVKGEWTCGGSDFFTIKTIDSKGALMTGTDHKGTLTGTPESNFTCNHKGVGPL